MNQLYLCNTTYRNPSKDRRIARVAMSEETVEAVLDLAAWLEQNTDKASGMIYNRNRGEIQVVDIFATDVPAAGFPDEVRYGLQYGHGTPDSFYASINHGDCEAVNWRPIFTCGQLYITKWAVQPVELFETQQGYQIAYSQIPVTVIRERQAQIATLTPQEKDAAISAAA